VSAMRANTKLLQVRWSKSAPLPREWRSICGSIHESLLGFSANPNICRTAMIREGFGHLSSLSAVGDRLGVDGFENVLTDWAAARDYVCAVLDPGEVPAITHDGDIESTGRAWHMTASLQQRPQAYGYIGDPPPMWRRLWMIVKLARAFVVLSVAQLLSDAHYDLAFRVATTKREFKRRIMR
jgi:hypothetical protein